MPRNRNQPAVIVPLSDEQEMTFSGFGNLLTGTRGESLRATLTRLFGSLERAREAWFDHGDRLLAEDATAGRRPPAWWLFQLDMDAPPAELQPPLLRQMGVLSESEERQLAEWASMVPSPPADLGIDRAAPAREAEVPLFSNDIDSADPGIRAVEDNHADDIDATPEPARPQATIEAVAEAGVPETPVTPPEILPLRRGIDDRKPAALTGWASHDA